MKSTLKVSLLALASMAAVGARAQAEVKPIGLANSGLTPLIGPLYESLDIVSRELMGHIPAVSRNSSIARAEVGQSITIPITPGATAADVTSGTTPPDDGDQAMGNITVPMLKSRVVSFRWDGTEQRNLNNGAGYTGIRNDQMTQAFRTLANEIEASVAGFARMGSRAIGTAGTTPFGSNLDPGPDALKILLDNGAGQSDIQMVVNTTAGNLVRKLSQLQKVNESGDTNILRQGILMPISGFDLRESAGIPTVTKGTGTGYLVNNGAGYAIGATAITVDTGTGTVLAGDIVTFAGDTNKYIAAGLTGSVLTLNSPGLRQAVADNAAITVGNNFAANTFFQRGAILLATRLPSLPEEGDSADDRTTIVDPRSGLAFEVAMYKQYRRVRYEVAIAWGGGNIKPAHSGVVLG